ncbi:MAG: stage V sporulation T C-terminal domain-containing protein [bacterium]|nr:AbrB/MazE/SpoVT family DNA-binding domain-containing protein [bacterium]MCI6247565.1 AbrB/MazE/SpoVT family DNA-binding domain-containing protein [bacterium]MDD5857144.1 stage V sporulation T C-terminal domain-containing protein [bacterium]MDD6717283.1 stage V sporulation T C-terminal domain-containing protein [bacterium]
MKATGIVRRIDELGRVVIPKEIRRTQRIRQGDALEIFTAGDGQVVFKKYSPLVELGQLSGVYAEVLAKNLGRPVLVCDRDAIVAATGQGKSQTMGREISDGVSKLLAMRAPYLAPEQPSRRLAAFEKGDGVLLCAAPIVVHGDIEGGVLLTGAERDPSPDAETARAVNIAAAFLARWMEE